jgi:hypothetical protein
MLELHVIMPVLVDLLGIIVRLHLLLVWYNLHMFKRVMLFEVRQVFENHGKTVMLLLDVITLVLTDIPEMTVQ